MVKILNRISLKTVFNAFFCVVLYSSGAQDLSPKPDSTALAKTDSTLVKEKPSRVLIPKRALIYSMVLPGAGQVYNGRLWKVPIVYAGLGTGVFFIKYNRDLYVKYRDGYELMVNKEITSFEGITRKEGVKQARDFYRKYMETSYFITGALYLLNGVEAYVDAHLKGFKVDEDLSLHLKIPKQDVMGPLQMGLALRF